MRKRWTMLILLMSLLMLLTACTIQSKEDYQKQNKNEQSIQAKEKNTESEKKESQSNDSQTDNVISNDNEKEEVVEAAESKQEDLKQEVKSSDQNSNHKTDAYKKQESKSTTKSTSQAKKETTTSETKKETTNQETSKGNQSEQPKPPKPQIVEPVKKHITISIRVDTILKNMDMLDKPLRSEKYVPSNGIILKTTKYELKEKETVFDILVLATKEYNIHMEYQGASENQFGSAYVEGINHLYEFSVGSLSGWMYSVNGWYPNYGASKYFLKDGDKIEWNYTCDLGRDLGVTWLNE